MEGLPFTQIWAVDFEFSAPRGERPVPLCVVARELSSGRLCSVWLDGETPPLPPYSVEADSLFVAYFASAEMGCHLALNWSMPVRILDLFTEFRCRTAGLTVPCGSGLLGALAYFGLDALGAAEKEAMRQLAIRGGPYTAGEREALITYCQSDVDSLAKLLPAMLPKIDLPRALLRGRYMAAVARMERNGTPIDTEALTQLRENWHRLHGRLIAAVNRNCGVYVRADRPPVNPRTRLGAAILAEADAWGIDVERLADAVEYVWRQRRDAAKEAEKARKASQQTTRRLGHFEVADQDQASLVGLYLEADQAAGLDLAPTVDLDLATEGEVVDANPGAVALEVRREQVKPKKHDPDILAEAAELVFTTGPEPDAYRPMSFSADRFAAYLIRNNIPWPRLESGALALDDNTFREMARAYQSKIGPIKDLRHTISQLRLNDIAVGADGRNRCLLSPFQSKTGRNQPSNSQFIFGPASWLRSLIKPGPGRAVAYIDWSQQELAIAAALSGDKRMQDAYVSGDFYLNFAKMAKAVPAEATKQSHAAVREQFKVVSLGVLYGLSAHGLARKLDVQPCRGWELLEMHKRTFPTFWNWSDRIEMVGMCLCRLQTVFGWTVHAGKNANPRSMRNFPMQANGAEMLRLACCLATEHGIQVCAPLHDALMVEGSAESITEVVRATQDFMRQASKLVLPGFPLRTDVKIVSYPDRYIDERGRRMWELITGMLNALDAAEPLAPVPALARGHL
jgi:hypothetical protein